MWPLDSQCVVSYWWTDHVSRTVVEILSFKDIWVTTLTFWGHVTSSVTWPLDLQYGGSYRWSIWTDLLSRTVFEILSVKSIGVTNLTFGVTWRHQSCDHRIYNAWFPIGSQYELTMYLARLSRYWASKIRVTTLTFRGHVTSSVTWPLDSQYGVSYRWSIRTDRLSRTVFEILSFKVIGVTSFDLWGHVTSSVMWSPDSQCVVSYWSSIWTDHASRTVVDIFAIWDFLLVVNYNRPSISHGFWDIHLQTSRLWPFGVQPKMAC